MTVAVVNSEDGKNAGEIVGTTTDGEAIYYYLDEDVTLNTYNITIIGNVVLCLNGKMPTGTTASSDGPVITIGNGTEAESLTLCDCSADDDATNATTRYFYVDSSVNGVYYYCEKRTNNDTCNDHTGDHEDITGGVITGGDLNESGNGAGVYVNNNAAFTMYGGAIVGNYTRGSSYYGGGVYIASDGEFTMKDGKITGNRAHYGGGVSVSSGAAFVMESGEISCNSSNYGGGVYINSGTFYMSGGEISSNTAVTGGDVRNYHGTIYMYDGTIDGSITNGYATGADTLFYMYGGTFNGELTNNEEGYFNMHGGYLSASVTNSGTFYMYSGYFSGTVTSSTGTTTIYGGAFTDDAYSSVYDDTSDPGNIINYIADVSETIPNSDNDDT